MATAMERLLSGYALTQCGTVSEPFWPWLYICTTCRATAAITAERVTCECGGLLDLHRISDTPRSVDLAPRLESSGYRYGDQLPCRLDDLLRVSLGADMVTPLLPHPEESNTWLKCDHLMPTGSFKDRGATVLTAIALQHGVKRMVVDSSGNAGASIAAHAARAAIECDVFVPDTTSDAKIRQTRAMGANVHLVPGPRSEAAKAAAAAIRVGGSFYASHVLNPHFHHGVKTWAFEVLDQLGEMPGTVVLPVGNGSLLLGVALGFDELFEQERIQTLPRIIAVQSQAFSTLSDGVIQSFEGGLPSISIAEGIAVRNPARLPQMLSALRKNEGSVVVVSDAQILSAQRELGRQGFYVEPTGAVAWAGYKSLQEQPSGPVVVALTGSGFKASLLSDFRQDFG